MRRVGEGRGRAVEDLRVRARIFAFCERGTPRGGDLLVGYGLIGEGRGEGAIRKTEYFGEMQSI